MQLYLTVRPEDTRTASAYPAGLAHAAYRIGEGSVSYTHLRAHET